MWFCGIILAFKLVFRALVIEFFLVVFGRFFGGILRAHDYRALPPLFGFFVWVIYALCILFGMGLVFGIYEKRGIIVGIMGIGGAVLGGEMLCTRLEKYYKILKCSPTDSLDTIKKAYRKLASEYHPDKIQSKDLPEAFIIFAYHLC